MFQSWCVIYQWCFSRNVSVVVFQSRCFFFASMIQVFQSQYFSRLSAINCPTNHASSHTIIAQPIGQPVFQMWCFSHYVFQFAQAVAPIVQPVVQIIAIAHCTTHCTTHHTTPVFQLRCFTCGILDTMFYLLVLDVVFIELNVFCRGYIYSQCFSRSDLAHPQFISQSIFYLQCFCCCIFYVPCFSYGVLVLVVQLLPKPSRKPSRKQSPRPLCCSLYNSPHNHHATYRITHCITHCITHRTTHCSITQPIAQPILLDGRIKLVLGLI